MAVHGEFLQLNNADVTGENVLVEQWTTELGLQVQEVFSVPSPVVGFVKTGVETCMDFPVVDM